MLKIKKDILLFDDGIKERLDFIIKYLNKEAVLFFNYDDSIYYKNFDTKIEFKNLRTFIENLD